MRSLRRPPPPPAAAADDVHHADYSRGRVDAPEDTPRTGPSYSPRRARSRDISAFFDDEYSSDENDAHSLVKRGKSREPPSSSDMDEYYVDSSKQAVYRLDPPDEDFGDRARHQVTRGKSLSSASRGRARSKSKGRKKDIQPGGHSGRLLDAEEELYEQYQDELFRQQPAQYAQQQPISSHYGQFDITPMMEMAPLNGRKSNKKKQRPTKESKSKGRYAQLEHDEEDVDRTIDKVLDTIPVNEEKRHKTHDEFYNLDESDESDSDYDEERPLRRSNSSSSFHIQRSIPTTPKWENCLNRTVVTLIALLSFVFIRDHTPWWKNYQSRVSMEEYQHNHVDDPMKVYNSNDDDSTHAKDHDPTNLYNKVSAGERISDRPAKKSLHHGFMDENYENRPPAKNSGLVTAKEAGVKNKSKKRDKETEDFLASVRYSPTSSGVLADKSSKNKAAYVKTKPQSVIPPPPRLRDGPKGSSYSDSDSSSKSKSETRTYNNTKEYMSASTTVTQAYHYNDFQSAQNNSFEFVNYKPNENESTANKDRSSAPNSSTNWSDFQFKQPNETEHSSTLLDTSYTINAGEKTMSEETMNMSADPANDNSSDSKLKDSKGAGNRQSVYSSKTLPKQSSGLSSSSTFDQSMTTKDVKSVYKDAFFRWNHPFRHDELEEINGGFDIPVFWRIPRSASGVVEATMSYCYGLTLANALGAGFQDETLHKIRVPAGAEYVNVDVSTPSGIEKAAEMNLASSRLADVISSPFIYETTAIFNELPTSGKCFTLLRHPVDRAVSQYHFYQKEDGANANNKQYWGMTIDEFAEAVPENNWMVRFLTGKRSGTLSWHDLEAAKEVFGRKCLVGLSDKAEESIRRYERFFRWNKRVSNDQQKENCLQTTLSKHDKRKSHPTYKGSNAWEVLRKKNEYDVLLYEYAINLYSQQSVLYENYE